MTEDTVAIDARVPALARFIEEHNGKDTVALYIGARSSFADYFIITTGSSAAHLRGLVRNILDYLRELRMEARGRKKTMDDDGWILIDCSTVVVHVFNEEKRSFYDLEKLWFDAETVYSSNSSSS